MSLPDEAVYPMLKSDFIVGWKNIRKEKYVGDSRGYSKKQACVGTTNGAGAANLQIFILSPDLTVMHALPGFWHPEDLAQELRFGKLMWQLYKDKKRTPEQKIVMFQRLQLAEPRYQSADTFARSDWQEFDKAMQRKDGDTVDRTDDGKIKVTDKGAPVLKSLNVLVHERMAARPFVKFDDFDFAAFTDYGRKYYDNNAGVDGKGRKLK